MRISTIVLNWNRKTLLEKCLQSCAATVDSPFQVVVMIMQAVTVPGR
jgi:GT2 family glycosyltransferase